MHRCLINKDDWDLHCITLAESESHHLLHVLRVKSGDEVIVFDGAGKEATAVVDIEENNEVVLHITAPAVSRLPEINITLLQAVPKGSRMDLIIEKGVELGVSRFVPLKTKRGIVKSDKHERWQRVAISAAKQCGISRIPEITPVLPLHDAISKYSDDGIFIIGALTEDALPIKKVLQKAASDGVQDVVVLIGPEGDLTAEEMKLATEAGGIPVSFGNLVLRVETAAIYAASVIMYALS